MSELDDYIRQLKDKGDTLQARVIKLEGLRLDYRKRLMDARKYLHLIAHSQCLNADGLRQAARFGLKITRQVLK
jgi:hypothetical protein